LSNGFHSRSPSLLPLSPCTFPPLNVLSDYIPQAYALYTTYYKPYSRYLTPLYLTLLRLHRFFYTTIFPLLYPLYTLCNNALHSLSSDTPDLLTLLILAAVLVVSLRLLDYMRRWVISWITFGLKVLMWVGMAGLGWYVWQRGVEQSLEDAGWVWGLLAGLEEEGERVGWRRAGRREREVCNAGKRGRTRGAGW